MRYISLYCANAFNKCFGALLGSNGTNCKFYKNYGMHAIHNIHTAHFFPIHNSCEKF